MARTPWLRSVLVLSVLLLVPTCAKEGPGRGAVLGASASIKDLMKARNLSESDVEAALKTFVPTGKKDDYLLFASGGQSGQILVIGVPSMRQLKTIAVFTPEPWQGYGYGGVGGNALLASGSQGVVPLTWADTHHPNLSETGGSYDGKYMFINDKANARVAVVDLHDFMTKQIVVNPLVASDHGGTFVDQETRYVIETSQYPAPLGRDYAPLDQYKEKYRGLMMMWKFDRTKGRIDPEKSFGIELPPYTQDLADAGKLESDGWAFVNSFNTEMATGGTLQGKPPIESGASQNDMDYLHIVNWKKAEELVAAGKTVTIKGIRVLPLAVAAQEKVLTLVGEPKSPHGCDVTPDGKDIIVGGKLDTHTTVFSFANIKRQIEAGEYESRDPYGIPVLNFKKSIRGQCEIGLGPLHTVFDDKGFAYTSVFLESVVAKWSVKDLKTVEKIPVHYNIGHIASAEGDTVSPDGKYVVAMNKMSLDRFTHTGPLYPQNFQLIDSSGEKMRIIMDMPIGNSEPHYAQMIKIDKLKPLNVYPAGTDPYTDRVDPTAVAAGKERIVNPGPPEDPSGSGHIVRNGNVVDVYMTAIRSHFTPDQIEVNQGDTVRVHVTNIEQSEDQTHGLAIGMYNIQVSLEPGKHENIIFRADTPGVFPMFCTEFCSALHLEMAGYLLVKPKGGAPAGQVEPPAAPTPH